MRRTGTDHSSPRTCLPVVVLLLATACSGTKYGPVPEPSPLGDTIIDCAAGYRPGPGLTCVKLPSALFGDPSAKPPPDRILIRNRVWLFKVGVSSIRLTIPTHGVSFVSLVVHRGDGKIYRVQDAGEASQLPVEYSAFAHRGTNMEGAFFLAQEAVFEDVPLRDAQFLVLLISGGGSAALADPEDPIVLNIQRSGSLP